MLLKLLKHEIRANSKIFLLIWPTVILLAAFNALLLTTGLAAQTLKTLFSTTFVFYMFAMIGVIFYSYIICIKRFYSGLLGKEGYIMFTLPVQPWQLILSKLITAIITITITMLVSIGSFILLLLSFDEVRTLLNRISFEIAVPDVGEVIYGIIDYLLSYSATILHIYLACALGHLFKKRRVLWSFVCYYGVSFATGIASGIVTAISSKGISDEKAIFITLLYNLIISCTFFFITERILRENLNLE